MMNSLQSAAHNPIRGLEILVLSQLQEIGQRPHGASLLLGVIGAALLILSYLLRGPGTGKAQFETTVRRCAAASAEERTRIL